MAKSLTRGLDFPEEKKETKKSKGNDGLKIGLSLGAIVVAGVLLAWTFGLFESTPPAADSSGNAPGHTVTPEQQQQQQQQKKLMELPEKDPHRPVQASG